MSQSATETQVARVHHLLLEVTDLDAALKFYVDTLGFAVRKQEVFRDGNQLVVLEQGLGLKEGGNASTGRIEHLCFSALGIDRIAKRAAAAGYEIVRGPGPGPYGHTVYIKDPDGLDVELFDDIKEG